MLVTWDLSAESPTLGGALTLRAEIETIARQKSISRIELSIGPADYIDSKVQSVINEVFLRSLLDFHIINEFKSEVKVTELHGVFGAEMPNLEKSPNFTRVKSLEMLPIRFY